MADKEHQRSAMARRLMMDYFNETLRDSGLITQREFFQIAQKIRQKYPEPQVQNR